MKNRLSAEKAGRAGKVTGAAIVEEEKELIKTLSQFPERVNLALREYEPSVITRYVLDLCAAFNRFYHNCQILSAAEENVVEQRVAMVAATKQVLGKALELICLRHPEKI